MGLDGGRGRKVSGLGQGDPAHAAGWNLEQGFTCRVTALIRSYEDEGDHRRTQAELFAWERSSFDPRSRVILSYHNLIDSAMLNSFSLAKLSSVCVAATSAVMDGTHVDGTCSTGLPVISSILQFLRPEA